MKAKFAAILVVALLLLFLAIPSVGGGTGERNFWGKEKRKKKGGGGGREWPGDWWVGENKRGEGVMGGRAPRKYEHKWAIMTPRRFLIVDEKMGIVFGFFMFNHPGTVLTAECQASGKSTCRLRKRPFSVELAEFFKIENNKIRQVEGVQLALPYKSLWDGPNSYRFWGSGR